MHYLYKSGETFAVLYDSRIENHPSLNQATFQGAFEAGSSVSGLAAGSYLIHEESPAFGRRTRYLGIVDDSCTVMQLTIGAFTSDTMDEPLHRHRIPGTYYVTLTQAAEESTFKYYQREYGDEVLPHIMANGMDRVDPAYKQLDPNWESLSEDELTRRLKALCDWWRDRGYGQLPGIASYTPCNALVRALKQADLSILHSIVPEQNWSDGKWAINHWGMPNQPFYVADDDFRKPTGRGKQNVIAMGMNSYHLYMPHVVNWGDNVLSPSHFLRWHRTVESRYQPERFTNFLLDYLKAVEGTAGPFFLIAGFEFGRTFGTTSMTDHNRKGVERIVAAAQTHNIVFATASDVAAYHQRHLQCHADAVWTQRDYLAGTRIMGKPINSGPSIGMEMATYKAVFAHQQNLPFYVYDYTEPWSFAFNDTEAPQCHAAALRTEIAVTQEPAALSIRVSRPLERPAPVAIWDARLEGSCAYTVYRPAVLDDGRVHCVLELPRGFSGELTLPLTPASCAAAAEFRGLGHTAWKVQMIGEGERRHCILFLDTPLTAPLSLPWKAPRDCRIDDIDRPMQTLAAGQKATLRFTPRKPWIRFWNVQADDLTPSPEILAELERVYIREAEMRTRLEEPLVAIQAQQDCWIRESIPADEEIVYDIDCFGKATTEEKSRAFSLDRTVVAHPQGVVAKEYADGGIAFAPGASYWCHPRGLHVEIENLGCYRESGQRFTVYLVCTAPDEQDWLYTVEVKSGFKILEHHGGTWDVPNQPGETSRFGFCVDPSELEIDHLSITIRCQQTAVLNDWFEDGGFIAALQRLVITETA